MITQFKNFDLDLQKLAHEISVDMNLIDMAMIDIITDHELEAEFLSYGKIDSLIEKLNYLKTRLDAKKYNI
jgi:hypothetical protein